MRKLLNANFSRLFKNKLFWWGMIVVVGITAFVVTIRYNEMLQYGIDYYGTADKLWFVGEMYISLLLSVFISFWLGTDYSNGTIRNKIVAGHTRYEIYFSNLAISAVLSVIYHIISIGVVCGLGYILFGAFETPVKYLLLMTAISVGAVIALSSVFTMLVMLIQNRAVSVAAAMLCALAMISSANTINDTLLEPEYIESAYEISQDGEVRPSKVILNPKYPTEIERAVCEQMLNVIPNGQTFQLASMAYEPYMVAFPFYSLGVILITSILGYGFFHKKDIK